jgi:hypothetical protein
MEELKFIVTGTHAYGPARAESDLDIVVRRKDIPAILDYLKNHNIETYQTEAQEEYQDGGFYFNIAFIQINVIVAMTDTHFMLWAGKTERMKKLPAIENRERRKELFNYIFNIAEIWS